MKIESLVINNTRIDEVISNDIIINTPEDGIELLGGLYYWDFDKIILYERNITSDFFVIKNWMAGEYCKSFLPIVSAWRLLVLFQSTKVKA